MNTLFKTLVILLLTSPLMAEMPEKLRADIEAELDPIFTKMQAEQDKYFKATGSYGQFFVTHSTTPKDGVTATPDNKHLKPSNMDKDWDDMLGNSFLSDKKKAAYGPVDYYNGPLGKGWVFYVSSRAGDFRYIKAINNGPETWRGHDWFEYYVPKDKFKKKLK